MSRHLGGAVVQSFRVRYKFHLELQGMLAALLDKQEEMDSALALLAGQSEHVLSERTFHKVYRVLVGVRDTFREVLQAADSLRLPPLPHLKTGAPLGPFLWDGSPVGSLGRAGESMKLKKIQKLGYQLAVVIDRHRHMHFKSLGAILAMQKEIARRFLNQFPEEDDVEVVSSEEGE